MSSGTAGSWGVGEFLVPVSLVPLRPAKFVSFLLAVQPTHTVHHISASPPGRPETTDLGSSVGGRKVRLGSIDEGIDPFTSLDFHGTCFT